MIVIIIFFIEGKKIVEYKGIVSSEVIVGVNLVKDFFVLIIDIFGGRFGIYENEFIRVREEVL